MPSLFAFLIVTTLLAPAARADTDLCTLLKPPEGTGLGCRIEVRDTGGARAVIAPQEGKFSEFSRMTLRRLEREGRDALAWEDPERWLESQMEIDLGAYVNSLEALARDPDNPFGGENFENTMQALAAGLGKLGRLALAGCSRPRRGKHGQHVLRCRFGAEPVALYMQVRLVEADGARYAINIRTLSERRLRHFEAIANGFRATS